MAGDLEIGRHRHPHRLGASAEISGEAGAGEDVERQPGHFRADIEKAAVPLRAPTSDQSVDRLRHRRREAHHRPAREHRRQHPPLAAPLLAFDGQKSVAQRDRQNPRLYGALAIVC